MRFLLTKLSHFFIFFLGLSVTAPFAFLSTELIFLLSLNDSETGLR